MKILGIDNGLDGGLICVDFELRVIGRLVMPTIDIMRNNHARRDYDLEMLAQALRSWQPDYVYLEEAQAMARPGATGGSVQSFATGAGFGIMRGLLHGRGWVEGKTIFRVFPQVWQKEMFAGLDLRRASDGKRDTKLASVQVAAELFPTVDWRASVRCKMPHSGLTDAACIASYGLKHYAVDRLLGLCQNNPTIDQQEVYLELFRALDENANVLATGILPASRRES